MAQVKRYNPKQNKSNFSAKKGYLLYFFLAPLFLAVILALLARDISAFGLNLVAFSLFYATAKLNTIGLANEFEYHKERLTKAPEKPFKTYAAALLGIATFFTATIAGGESFLTGIFLSIISTVGYILYYGLDPREDKLENIGDVSADLVLKTLLEAQNKLDGIQEHMEKILKDQQLYNKLSLAVRKAEHILQTIKEDPKDIRVARKFLIVYIDGLEKVTESYTALDESEIKKETREKLHQLLDDVEHRFDKELGKLKRNNEFDLDVNIDVLHQQIKN